MTKETIESVGLQAMEPKPKRFNKKTIYSLMLGLVLITGVSFWHGFHKKSNLAKENDAMTVNSNITHASPLDSKKMTYETLGKFINTSLLGGSGQHASNEASEKPHKPFHPSQIMPKDDDRKEKEELSVEEPDPLIAQIEEFRRQQQLIYLRAEDEARQSDLVLTNADSNQASQQMSSSADMEGLEGMFPKMNMPNFSENSYKSQNSQDTKKKFIHNAQSEDPEFTSRYQEEPFWSPYTLTSGTIIPCTLLTAVNSDLPGDVIAYVREPVYSSVSGRYLIVPQGAKLIGKYSSDISYGQNRIQVVFQRLIFPENNRYPHGYSINLSGLQGSTLDGQVGLKDKTNNHYGKLILGAVLSSALSAAATRTEGDPNFPKTYNQRAAEQAGANLTSMGNKFVSKELDRAPSITIRAGTPLNVMVMQDLVLNPYGKQK